MTKLDQVSLCDCDFVPLLSVVNYCRASFEIVTRIRRMAPLLYIINFSKLRLRVKNETTFISAKKSCRSEQYFRSYKLHNRVAPFFGPPCILSLNCSNKCSQAYALYPCIPYFLVSKKCEHSHPHCQLLALDNLVSINRSRRKELTLLSFHRTMQLRRVSIIAEQSALTRCFSAVAELLVISSNARNILSKIVQKCFSTCD